MLLQKIKRPGLLAKVMLFSPVPAYLIVGIILYSYISDLRKGISQSFIEESLSAANVIQRIIKPEDMVRRSPSLTWLLNEIVQVNPGLLKITIYAKVDGKIIAIASTDPEKVGDQADEEDTRPIFTGEPEFEERLLGNIRLLETLSPYFDDKGKPFAAVGVYTSLNKRDMLASKLIRDILWLVIPGCALVYIVFFFIVRHVLLVPIRELAKGVQKVAQGEFGYRLPVKGQDEISDLIRAFNIMAVDLQNLVVAQKTKIKQMALLHEASSHLATEDNLDALMERLVDYPRQLVESEMSALYLLDAETGKIIHFKHAGVDLSRFPIQEQPTGRGLLGAFLRDGSPVRLNDISQDPRSKGLPAHHPPVKSFIGIPLTLRGKVIGGLTAANKLKGESYSQEDEEILSTLASQAAVAIERMRLFEATGQLAMTDSLTGFFNRREFQKRLELELERSSRYGRDFSLLILDIDHFKTFNDTYGHQTGDKALKEIAALVKDTVRTTDTAARYGGEEFVIIAPETSAEKAKLLAERIRKNVMEHPFTIQGGYQKALEVSIGVASYPLDAQDPDTLIQLADRALYFAKEAGRNQVCLYSEKTHTKN